MSNIYRFINVYKQLAAGYVEDEAILSVYWDLCGRIKNNEKITVPLFKGDDITLTQASLFIDKIAEEFITNPLSIQDVYRTDIEPIVVTSALFSNVQSRKLVTEDIFLPSNSPNMVLLEKQQEMPVVGMTTKENISEAINEYERLYKADLASPAETLTLARYYGPNSNYARVVLEKQLEAEENEPLVVGGPASVEGVDAEGHLITTEALGRAFNVFMKNVRARNLQIFHSDVQVGWALPAYITKTGRVFKSGVDDKCLWLVSELRSDMPIAKKVAEEIRNGDIRSYSIAGSATDTEMVKKGNQPVLVVKDLVLAEITYCLVPGTKVWTKDGLKVIENITVDDYVYTHENRWRKVNATMKRHVDEEIVCLHTDFGKVIELTGNHAVRKLAYGGQHKGTCYEWVVAGDIRIGDVVSTHIPLTNYKCFTCNSPVFRKWTSSEKVYTQRVFCNRECRKKASGNRLGSTGFCWWKGLTKKELPNLTGGIKTLEGREKQRRSVTSREFRLIRSKIQKEKSNDIVYKDTVLRKAGYVTWNNKNDDDKRNHILNMIRNQVKGRQINKLERDFLDLLKTNGLNEWKFVGDGKTFFLNNKHKLIFPDFWNGDKKVIEVYGNYWHTEEEGKDRIECLNNLDYGCLIIWEKDIRNNPKQVIDLVKEFAGNSLATITSKQNQRYTGFVYNIEVEEDHSYTTDAMVVKNCKQGVNLGAHFEILKACSDNCVDLDETSIRNILKSEKAYSFWGSLVSIDEGKIIIKADRPNSITDQIEFELGQSLSPSVKFEVSEILPIAKTKACTCGGKVGCLCNDNKDGKKSKPIEIRKQDERPVPLPIRPSGDMSETLDVLERVNYRPAEKELEECHNCFWFSLGYCLKLHVPVDPEYVCDLWRANPNPRESERWAEVSHQPFEETEKDNTTRNNMLKEWVQKSDKEIISHNDEVNKTEVDRRKKLRELQKYLGLPVDEFKEAEPYKSLPDSIIPQSFPWQIGQMASRVRESKK